VLEQTGVSITNKRLLRVMADPGQKLDFDEMRIRFDPDFVEQQRKKAPRNSDRSDRHVVAVKGGVDGVAVDDPRDPCSSVDRAADMGRSAVAVPSMGRRRPTSRRVRPERRPARLRASHAPAMRS
jgi:hypothetical protein